MHEARVQNERIAHNSATAIWAVKGGAASRGRSEQTRFSAARL